jgi:cytochrome P450
MTNGIVPRPLDFLSVALTPEFRENPYQFLELLREHEPVHQTPFGVYLITRHADASAIDLGRENANRNVAFGGGHHFCLGASLARLEGAVAIGTLVRRFPRIERAGPPERRTTFTLRGLEHLRQRSRSDARHGVTRRHQESREVPVAHRSTAVRVVNASA